MKGVHNITMNYPFAVLHVKELLKRDCDTGYRLKEENFSNLTVERSREIFQSSFNLPK